MASDNKIKKIKICVVTTDRSDYGRLKTVMEAIKNESRFELQVIAGSHLFFDHLLWYLRHAEPVSWWKSFPWYIRARMTSFLYGEGGIFPLEHSLRVILKDNFPIHARLPMILEGGNPRVMTKIGGFALLGVSQIFEKLRPDIILINGDRFEMLPIAFAAVCENIRLAHIEGGDTSGTIDESIRHAITKLAHIHFPATITSAKRIRAMGENPKYIFPVGSPVIDFIVRLNLSLDNSLYERHGPGGGLRIDFTKPFILVLQHPVTTRYEENRRDMEVLISAVDSFDMQKLFLASNIDAGSDGVSSAIRAYRDKKPAKTTFFKSLAMEDFYRVLKNAAVAVGNSSSFIREGAFLGTPAVIVGDRQKGRERGKNVIEVEPRRDKIINAIQKQLVHGCYPPDFLFGNGGASQKIIEVLANMDLDSVPLQKHFHDPNL